jgi:hypothetical protein
VEGPGAHDERLRHEEERLTLRYSFKVKNDKHIEEMEAQQKERRRIK